MIVVGLCAEWCPVCRDFEPAFARLAAEWPAARFVWLDVDDDAAAVGDVDVDDFPTLAVYRDGRALHFGAALPQEALVRRLLLALSRADRAAIEVPDAVATLPERLPQPARRLGAE
jgi:thioredoxin 1